MKVSIIIPFHKGDAFLEDCLESLRQGNYFDIETIIIEDHYTGDIERVIEPYQQELNIVCYQLDEEKQGVSAARNLGLDKAQGEYVYFLDSDDYIFENAIGQLVEAADEEEADVIYGKKKYTWFKRKVFLEELEKGSEEEEEETDDSEEADSQTEEQEIEEETEEIPFEELLMRKRKLAASRLLTKRVGLRHVSILNILIRRKFIEENNIRFNETILYYADLSFVIEVLEKARLFRKCYGSVYIKRNHNDPINFPAVSQMGGAEKFNEYVEAYYYAISLIPEDSDIRIRLDKKVINFYCNYFVTRIRRSKNPAWKNERFDTMQKLVSQMNPQAVSVQKGYKKKLLKSLLEGNVNKTLSLVNKKLGVQKVKKIIKNRREIVKYCYRKYFLKKPILENYILFESFQGRSYSDSPKYIYEYICKNYPGKYKCIWALNDTKTEVPYGAMKVKRYGMQYAYYLACCKYYVVNVRQPLWYEKREDAILLETWHGTPLKKLFFDVEEVHSAAPLYKKEVYKQAKEWDYLIAANLFSSEHFKDAFMFENKMLEYGYPRNDIMHYENKDEIADGIRTKLGIPKDKKTILYAPTWRDDEYFAPGQYKFELKLDLKKLQQELGDEYVVILRTHYLIANQIDVAGMEDFVFNLSKYNDISELYLISDICITDYSSVFFDYANLKRPMLFFTYDLEKYRDVLRGFYIDIEEELPGPLLFDNDQLVDAIKNIDRITEQYSEKYDKFYEKYCGLEDGHASENVVKEVFGL